MKSLTKYLTEVCSVYEAKDKALQTMILSYNDHEGTNVVNWIRENNLLKNDKIQLGKNGFITLEQLQQLYIYAERNNKPCPMIGNYHGNAGDFVFRRWVGVGESVDILEDIIDINKSGGIYKGLHNTNMKEDGKWFPSAEDMESVISYAWNKKKNFFTSDSENILYVTGKDPISDSKSEQLMAYYAGNQDAIDHITDAIPDNCGKLRKLPDGSPSTKEWAEAGKYSRKPDETPKTDIISDNGMRISLKKSGGSQLMSGFESESRATLTLVSKQFGEDIQQKVESLFTEPWAAKLTKDDKEAREKGSIKNRELTEIVKELFSDAKFKKAVLMEAATGELKFGKNADSCAEYVFVWNDVKAMDNKWYKIESYVDHCMPTANPIVAYKTAGKTSTSLRVITK